MPEGMGRDAALDAGQAGPSLHDELEGATLAAGRRGSLKTAWLEGHAPLANFLTFESGGSDHCG